MNKLYFFTINKEAMEKEIKLDGETVTTETSYYKKQDVSFLLNNKAILKADDFSKAFNTVSTSLAYLDARNSLKDMEAKKDRDMEAEENYRACIKVFYDDNKDNIDTDIFVKLANDTLYHFLGVMVWCHMPYKVIYPKCINEIIGILRTTNIQDKKAISASKSSIALHFGGFYDESNDTMKKWDVRLKDTDVINMIMLIQSYRVNVREVKDKKTGITKTGYVIKDKTSLSDIKNSILQIFASSYGFIDLKKHKSTVFEF